MKSLRHLQVAKEVSVKLDVGLRTRASSPAGQTVDPGKRRLIATLLRAVAANVVRAQALPIGVEVEPSSVVANLAVGTICETARGSKVVDVPLPFAGTQTIAHEVVRRRRVGIHVRHQHANAGRLPFTVQQAVGEGVSIVGEDGVATGWPALVAGILPNTVALTDLRLTGIRKTSIGYVGCLGDSAELHGCTMIHFTVGPWLLKQAGTSWTKALSIPAASSRLVGTGLCLSLLRSAGLPNF